MKPELAIRQTAARRIARAGFTLLEVMVALFIFASILTSLYMTWRILLRSNASALEIAANAQRSRLAIQTIEEALNSAVFFNANASHYAFLADTGGDSAALSFVAHLGDSFPGSGRFDGESVRRVTFTVRNTRDSSELLMQQNSLLARLDESQEAYPIVLAREVSGFQLEFWDTRKGEFAPEWLRTNLLPAVVRVTLGFGRKGRYSHEPAEWVTRVIRIPSAGVAGEAQGSPVPNPGPGR